MHQHIFNWHRLTPNSLPDPALHERVLVFRDGKHGEERVFDCSTQEVWDAIAYGESKRPEFWAEIVGWGPLPTPSKMLGAVTNKPDWRKCARVLVFCEGHSKSGPRYFDRPVSILNERTDGSAVSRWAALTHLGFGIPNPAWYPESSYDLDWLPLSEQEPDPEEHELVLTSLRYTSTFGMKVSTMKPEDIVSLYGIENIYADASRDIYWAALPCLERMHDWTQISPQDMGCSEVLVWFEEEGFSWVEVSGFEGWYETTYGKTGGEGVLWLMPSCVDSLKRRSGGL